MTEMIENRKAYHDYFVLNTLECGIALMGHEVKSIREGKCTLKDAYCFVTHNELFLTGAHISKYTNAFDFDIAENRDRKLLAHKSEITTLSRRLTDVGITLVPLKIYFVKGKAKVLIGICKGKHNYDKREALKAADAKREIERSLKNY